MVKADKKPQAPPAAATANAAVAADDTATPDAAADSSNAVPGGVGIYIGARNESLQRHGTGWAHLPNGDFYKGAYSNGQRHGYGLYVFRNGSRYIGNYQRDSRHGSGSFYYADGSIYAGDWKWNLRHGLGRYTYANGDCYEGGWQRDRRHGLGTYTLSASNGGYRFNGEWANGVASGAAVVATDAYRLHCVWQETAPIGPAVFAFGCKTMAVGHFEEDDTACEIVAQVDKREASDATIVVDSEKCPGGGESEEVATTVPPAVPFRSRWVCQEVKPYNVAEIPPGPQPKRCVDREDIDSHLPAQCPSGQLFAYRDREQTSNTKMTAGILKDAVRNTFQSISAGKC